MCSGGRRDSKSGASVRYTKGMRSARGFTLIEMLIGLVLLSVTATAVIGLIVNSNNTAGDLASVAAQNSKMRSAMALIQRELSEANNPLVNVGVETCTSAGGECAGPAGTSVSFIRVQTTASGARVYLAERFQYNGPTASGKLRNTITQQVVRSNSAFANNAAAAAAVAAAPTKVILDKVVPPAANDPLFQYYKSATNPVNYTAGNTAWYSDVALVEVNLRRDEDMSSSDSNPADAVTKQRFPVTRLASSVYMKRIGQQTEGDDDDLSC
jgi:prepilin-type N-terminal cleavage/methylation domain-containing protein